MWLRHRSRIMGGVVLVLMLAMFVSPSGAVASGPPCRFFGSVKINDQPAEKGTAIKVWLQKGGNTTWEQEIETGTNPAGDPIPDDIYLLDVPAYDPSAPGAKEGDTVYFSVEGIIAQTGTWVPGGFIEHDLSVTAPAEPTVAFSPSHLSFSAIQGGDNPQGQTLEIWNSGAGTLNWGVTDNAGWLSLSPTSGSSTGEHDEVTASVNTAGMSAGNYSATITIAAAGAINTPRTFSVSLTITETAVPAIAFSPAGLSFTAVAGEANPVDKTLEIWNSGTGNLDWSVSDDAAWLALAPTSGSSTGEHDAVTASVNTAGMSAGNYSATITIAAAGATNTPRTVAVSLTITETAAPTIAFGPASLSFSAVAGEASPATKTLEIWNSGTGILDWSASDDAAWLTLVPANGSSTGEHDVVTASVDITGMAAGSYPATITITAAGATDTPRTLAVSLTLTETAAPTIAFGPASLSFSAVAGEANPANQTLEIWNSGTGTLAWSVSDNAAWLTLAPTNGSSTGEHDVVTASVDITGMAAGSYPATITITAAGATNTPRTLAVSLTLTETESPVSPIDTLRHMAPWIGVGAAVIVGIILLVRRRRSGLI